MVLLDLPLWIVLLWVFAFGAAAGSFLNVCIYRIPQRDGFWESLAGLWSPPSSCPRCGNRILMRDNVPILGWLMLRGRCRFCDGRISPRYPLIELGNGLLLVLLYWWEIPAGYGATLEDGGLYAAFGPRGVPGSTWLSPVAVLHWRYLYHVVLVEMLVAATFIDIDLKIIPDGVTLPALAVGIVGAVVIGRVHLVPLWFQLPSSWRDFDWLLEWFGTSWVGMPRVPAWQIQHPHWHGLAVSLAGFVFGGGVIWAVRWIGFLTLKQEAMGFGDVILMAVIGSFLGWQPVLMIFVIAPACAMVWTVATWAIRREREIPYGPYIAAATLIVLFAWRPLWSYAEPRFAALAPWLPVFAVIGSLMMAGLLLLTRWIKIRLGIPLYPDEWVEEWTSADHLWHFSGENVDLQQGNWRTPQWPGVSSGRGMNDEETWRGE